VNGACKAQKNLSKLKRGGTLSAATKLYAAVAGMASDGSDGKPPPLYVVYHCCSPKEKSLYLRKNIFYSCAEPMSGGTR